LNEPRYLLELWGRDMKLARPFLRLLLALALTTETFPAFSGGFNPISPPMAMRTLRGGNRGGNVRASRAGARKKKGKKDPNELARQKLISRYNDMYGIKPPPREVDLDMLADQRPLHLKEKIYRAQDQKNEIEAELEELKKKLEEDKAKKISKRMLPEELEELQFRQRELTQRLGEVSGQLKRYELKKKFNQEQKQRIDEGKRPFLVFIFHLFPEHDLTLTKGTGYHEEEV